ncbi:MAG: peptidoglycan DD-metalloendopeptidase family protein [Polyangiales bacterium]|nr:peptidoglycan DD-metalloendopeptidase family protein [Myxococcales bacterium]
MRRFVLIGLLLALGGVSVAIADNAPAAGVLDQNSIRAQLERDEARKGQVDAEVSGLGARRAAAGERLEGRTRSLYRISRAGFAPLAGGFTAMLEHVSRIERMKRLVRTELASLEHLRSHGAALREESARLAVRISSTKAQLTAFAENNARVEEEARMAALFNDAFEKPVIRPADSGRLEYGTIRVHDDETPRSSFATQRGQLVLPVAGSAQVREAHREDGMGVEFVASPGAGVRSAAEGTVVFAGEQSAYGRIVIVDHGDRYFTVYGGLGDIQVREGDMLSRGARLGHTGAAPLYIEVRRGTKSLDARAWLGV